MRVVAGTLKGQKLLSPEGLSTRPPLEKLKGALFNSLGELIEGSRVLDLFAGSGSFGIEALSRGAKSCTFIELQREALKCLSENLRNVDSGNYKVIRGKIPTIFEKVEGPFDLIFNDPPFTEIGKGKFLDLDKEILPLLSEGGIVISRWPNGFENRPPCSGLEIFRERIYGASVVQMFKHAEKNKGVS